MSLFSVEIGIIQFRALKLKICPKQPGLLYFQNITRICLKTELHFDKFLGLMGSKFEYISFKEIRSDDAFFQPELGWSVLGVVGPDLDRWRAGLQAPRLSGLK